MGRLKLDPWRPIRRGVDRLLERRGGDRPDLGEAERLAALRLHGGFALAYATTRAADAKGRAVTRAFGDADGYIAYGEKMGYVLALGDPVCAPTEREALIERFIAAFGDPVFVQVSSPVADILAARGYRITPFGVDTVLSLDGYSFDGKSKDGIRYASNWLKKRGFSIAEDVWSEPTAAAMAAITEDWRGSRVARRREMQFLNRGLPLEAEPGVRIFLLREPAGRPVAFVMFDPLYRDGALVGYVTALKRRLDAAGPYAELGLMRHAIDLFKREGLGEVRLGLSPLAPFGTPAHRPHRLLAAMFRRLYESPALNARIFNFKGQAQFKKRFHGEEEPLHLAIRKGFPLAQLIALVRLSKMV